jgi:hypothetical protein
MPYFIIGGEICKSRCTTGINNTGSKNASGVNYTVEFATGLNDIGGKFSTSTAGVVETGGNLPPVSLTLAVNFPLVSTKPVANHWNKLYVNSTTNLSPNKIIKTFLIEDFFHLHLEL